MHFKPLFFFIFENQLAFLGNISENIKAALPNAGKVCALVFLKKKKKKKKKKCNKKNVIHIYTY